MKRITASLVWIIKKIWLILRWTILFPIIWTLGYRKNHTVVHAYPKFIFTWVIIVLFAGLAYSINHNWISSSGAGWLGIIALMLVALTIGIDLNRNVTIFWFVTILCSWFGIILLHERGYRLFSRVGDMIASLKPEISSDFCLAISIIYSIFYLFVVLKAWINDRWTFGYGEIEHKSFGHSDDSIGRGAKCISTTYPDFLELLFGLSGTITIWNAQKTRKLAIIENVLLLPFKAKVINRLLETVQVTTSSEEEDVPDDDNNEGQVLN